MILRIHFLGGPLDGATVEGYGPDGADNWQNLAAIIRHDTEDFRVGSLFEMFNPFMLIEGAPQFFLQLHRYRIELKLTAEGGDPGDIHVSYAGTSSRALEVSAQARRQWVSR